jgi:hypothetical protein
MNLEDIHANPTEDDLVSFVANTSPLLVFSLSSWQDKFLLHRVSRLLRPGSVVVEIGTYLGGSAAILAHANPALEINSYDLYDSHKLYDKNHYTIVETALGKGQIRTLENVKEHVSRYPNIKLHQVDDNEAIKFERQVDLLLEDSSHQEPQLTVSLSNWLPKIKVGGILMIHDYRPWGSNENHELRHLPVDRHVELLSTNDTWKFLGPVTNNLFLRQSPCQPSSFAIFQRIK